MIGFRTRGCGKRNTFKKKVGVSKLASGFHANVQTGKKGGEKNVR